MGDGLDLAAELASARAEVEAAERERDEGRAVLRRVEWPHHLRQCLICQRYQPGYWNIDPTEEGHAPDCALAAALDPPPRGATGPSGTRDGRGEAADGGEGGGGAAHGEG